jgi:predicted PurR-regulated permease PerM
MTDDAPSTDAAQTEAPASDPTPAAETAPGSWMDRHLWQIQPVRDVLMGLGVLGLLWLGRAVSIVTVPLLLAILFAYLFEPVIKFMIAKLSIKRRTAVAAVIVGAVVLVGLPAAGGLVVGAVQAYTLLVRTSDRIALVDKYVEASTDEERTRVRNALLAPQPGSDFTPPANGGADGEDTAATSNGWVWIAERADMAADDPDIADGVGTVRTWLRANTAAIAERAAAVGIDAARGIASFATWVIGLGLLIFLTIFFFYFVSTGWGQVQGFGAGLLPFKHRERVLERFEQFDAVISGFIRGRLTIAFLQSIVFTIAYLIIGVPAAFLLGPLVAVLSIVPYAALIGLPISVTLLWLEPYTGIRGAWWWVIGAPAAVYFLGQALDDYVWTPLIQGKSTNMDTPTILFASLAGGVLFGIFGLLIAIPLAACVKILIREEFWPRFKEWQEGRAKDFLPIDEK